MKSKYLFPGLILFILPLIGFSQDPGPGPLSKEARQRIEAQRIGFITQKLNLTPDEAAKFWPIYNQHKEALRDMRDEMERPDLMNITDDEATVIIEKHLQQEQKRLELKKKLYSQLRTVITPRKIILLHTAEMEFNRELLRRANGKGPVEPRKFFN
jgi:hypothetical protein